MRRSRTGFTLIESCAAAALLAATLTLTVSLLTGVARQRQAAAMHAQAILAADNLLERLTNGRYDQITPERADEVRRELDLEQLLPDGEARVDVAAEAGSPRGKRIAVEITWKTSGTAPPSRHQVATWVYRWEGK